MLDSQFRKIVKGDINYHSNCLGLNFLIARLKRNYLTKPGPDTLDDGVSELQTFFTKYKRIVTLDAENLKNL